MNSVLDLLNSIELHKPLATNEFNIFKVLGIQYNEVLICRFLGELLNPNGTHGCGALFLDEFFKTVIKKNIKNLQNADVILEDRTDNGRRVDIAVYTEGQVFPIEVKVWAKDQNSQLSDYWKYYESENKIQINNIYYLTPDGKRPSDESLGELRIDEQCILLSFKDDVRNWLENCALKLDDRNMKHEIRQFRGVIETMCKDYTESEKVVAAVFNSDKTKNSALQILKYKEEIFKEFRRDFLKNRIELGNAFKLDTSLTIDEYMIGRDKENLLAKVKLNASSETTIAYICYQTNLYIYVPEPINRVKEIPWRKVDTEDGWTYLEFTKGKAINLKEPEKNDDPKFWDDTQKINLEDYVKIK